MRQKLRHWAVQFALSHNGVDELGIVTYMLALLFLLLATILDVRFFLIVALVLFVWSVFRTFSRNIEKRDRENQRILEMDKKIETGIQRLLRRRK